MKIYTKSGDQGKTGLVGGVRVSKIHPQVEAYGELDELNSCLGVVLAAHPDPEISTELLSLQTLLFEAGADLATAPDKLERPRISEKDVAALEQKIDRFTPELPRKNAFVLPGGSPAAAQLHLARTISRRAERRALAAVGDSEAHRQLLVFLNRLSDFLFVLARLENTRKHTDEPCWHPATDLQ